MSAAATLKLWHLNLMGKNNARIGTLVKLKETQTCFVCGKTLQPNTLAIRQNEKYSCPHNHKKKPLEKIKNAIQK